MPGRYESREERIEIKGGQVHHFVSTTKRELTDKEVKELMAEGRKFGDEMRREAEKMFKGMGSMFEGFFGKERRESRKR